MEDWRIEDPWGRGNPSEVDAMDIIEPLYQNQYGTFMLPTLFGLRTGPTNQTVGRQRMDNPTNQTNGSLRMDSPTNQTIGRRRMDRPTNQTIGRPRMDSPTNHILGRPRMESPTNQTIGRPRMDNPTNETARRQRLSIIDPHTGIDIFSPREETPYENINVGSIHGGMRINIENEINCLIQDDPIPSDDPPTQEETGKPTEDVAEDIKTEVGQVIQNKIVKLNTALAKENEQLKAAMADIKGTFEKNIKMLDLEHKMRLKAEQDKYMAEMNSIEEKKSKTKVAIEQAIKKLSITLDKLQDDTAEVHHNVRKDMECTICFDEMKPPTRIFDCTSGHLICEECKDRMGGVKCPTCKEQNVAGRNLAMERLARTLYGQQ